jgi:hypothetical protein
MWQYEGTIIWPPYGSVAATTYNQPTIFNIFKCISWCPCQKEEQAILGNQIKFSFSTMKRWMICVLLLYTKTEIFQNSFLFVLCTECLSPYTWVTSKVMATLFFRNIEISDRNFQICRWETATSVKAYSLIPIFDFPKMKTQLNGNLEGNNHNKHILMFCMDLV